MLGVDVKHAIDWWRHLPRGGRPFAALGVVVPDEVGGTRPVAVEDLPVGARDVHVAAVARLVVSDGLTGAVADATAIAAAAAAAAAADAGIATTADGTAVGKRLLAFTS